MTTTKVRPKVGELIRFGDRDIEAEVVSVTRGWILAKVNDPAIKYGYVMLRESQA